MSENQTDSEAEFDAAAEATPLEKVKAQQAQMQNHEVEEERVDSDADIPGHSKPSDIRKHPQRTQY